MTDGLIHELMTSLSLTSREWNSPAVTKGDPFKVLISCILSLRTHDRTTEPASERLFALASDAVNMAELSPEQVEQAIYPVGFYRTKAQQIIAISRRLCVVYGGRVPDDINELLTFKGDGVIFVVLGILWVISIGITYEEAYLRGWLVGFHRRGQIHDRFAV